MIQLSQHAVQRAAQRSLTFTEITYVLMHAQRYHCAGVVICYLRRRDILVEDRDWQHLSGTAIVMTKDGQTVITVWRDARRGLKKIRCKPKFDLNSSHKETDQPS